MAVNGSSARSGSNAASRGPISRWASLYGLILTERLTDQSAPILGPGPSSSRPGRHHVLGKSPPTKDRIAMSRSFGPTVEGWPEFRSVHRLYEIEVVLHAAGNGRAEFPLQEGLLDGGGVPLPLKQPAGGPGGDADFASQRRRGQTKGLGPLRKVLRPSHCGQPVDVNESVPLIDHVRLL